MPIGPLRELEVIEPSEMAPRVLLHPCSARLHDGTVSDCVYFITAGAAERLFGTEGVSERPRISPEQVVSVAESPARLPASFANQIYRAGETHYSCYIFTLVFSRWRRRKYLVVGPVDFLFFPRGRGPSDVKDVVLHSGSNRPSDVPAYKWCVYSS
jgi:hypothetical protein